MQSWMAGRLNWGFEHADILDLFYQTVSLFSQSKGQNGQLAMIQLNCNKAFKDPEGHGVKQQHKGAKK